MKIDKLKSMIKEAVREAVREEIKEILTEAVSTASTPVRQESKPIVQKVQKPRFKAIIFLYIIQVFASCRYLKGRNMDYFVTK